MQSVCLQINLYHLLYCLRQDVWSITQSSELGGRSLVSRLLESRLEKINESKIKTQRRIAFTLPVDIFIGGRKKKYTTPKLRSILSLFVSSRQVKYLFHALCISAFLDNPIWYSIWYSIRDPALCKIPITNIFHNNLCLLSVSELPEMKKSPSFTYRFFAFLQEAVITGLNILFSWDQ